MRRPPNLTPLVLVICLFFAPNHAVACLNEYGTAADGTARLRVTMHHEVPEPTPIDVEHYRQRIESLTPRLGDSPSHEELSDLAVAHLYVGQTGRAIELLEQAEAQHAGEYTIAANLGTAYELDGRTEQALQWIEEGIRRNPQSHHGSEWIHANLLKAKIKMERDPRWIDSGSVTGLHFGEDPLPAHDPLKSAANCPQQLEDIEQHLKYQLHERRQFIPGPDPVVAALMFDLANTIALDHTVEEAIPFYESAKELGYHDTALLGRRIDAMKQLQNENRLSGLVPGIIANRTLVQLGLFAAALLSILIAVGWRFLLPRNINADRPQV